MIDELEALGRFRHDTAPPAPDARARARRALCEAIAAEGSTRHGRARRPARRRLAVAGAVAAVAVAGALVSVTHPLGSGGGSGAGLPSGLRNAILTAYDSGAVDILHVHQTLTASNGDDFVRDSWASLSPPPGGQQVHTRMRVTDAGGAPLQDFQLTYTLPAKLGSGSTRTAYTPVGDVIDVEYRTRTWSHQTDGPVPQPPTDTPDVVTVGSLRNSLARGRWSDLGPSTLDGRQVIELSQHNPPSGKSLIVWIDPHTYLPIRELFTYSFGHGTSRVDGTVTSTPEYLPPTTANLAQLQVTIPAGFTQTPAPPVLPGR
jgi:hypothetical protein